MDLGPLEPRLASLVYTKDRKVHLVPPEIEKDVERLERKLAQEVRGLVLIGRRDIRTNNSWMHNSQRLVKGRDRCTLLVNSVDARARGLATGGQARITSRVGSLVASVEVTDDVAPGVVSLPHGWGHAREGVQLRIAREHAGVSVNDLTDEGLYDELSGNATVTGVPVEVEAVIPATAPAAAPARA
jgi:anaerobic selenocysteine-containing dehydrogenase